MSAPKERKNIENPYGHARMSRQRAVIARAIEVITGAFTADGLVAQLREDDPGIGQATVYRAIGALAESGWIQRVGARDGSTLYARCEGGQHHHHLVCTSCGAVTRAECPFGEVRESATTPEGFTVTHHEVTLYGLCPNCSDRRTRK